MTPLELIYPIIGLMFALGGGIYAWQTRRSFAQAMADLQAQQQALRESKATPAAPVALSGPPSEEILHIQGKLRHLEQDLQQSQKTLQETLAAQDELSHNYQAQEKVVATLRHQLTQQQAAEGDRLKALQQQNQDLRQENSNLSDRLRQSVNSLAEIRPKLLQLQTVEAKNQQLSEQLQRVNQDRQTEIAQQLAERETIWQQQNQALTDQVSQLAQQIQQLTAERDGAQQDWQKERDQLNAKLNNLDATQKSLALTNQALTVKLETTQAQGDRLKAEKKEQALALQAAQAEVGKLQQQLVDLTAIQAPSPAEPDLPLAESKADEVEPSATESATLAPPVEVAAEPEPETDVDAEADISSPLVEAESKPVVDQSEPATIAPPAETVAEPVVESTSEPEPEPTLSVESTPEPETTVTDEAAQVHGFADKKVVILGTLNTMNRETAKTRLQDLGAHYTSAPSSKTDYVVVGKAPGAKLKKAQKLGIPQLSEAQFLEMIGD